MTTNNSEPEHIPQFDPSLSTEEIGRQFLEKSRAMPYDTSRVGQVEIFHVSRPLIQAARTTSEAGNEKPANSNNIEPLNNTYMIKKNQLRKIHDLINAEGTILGLYTQGDKYYLGSLLNDGSRATVYYSAKKEDLKDYLESKITLNELYLKSEGPIVTRSSREGEQSFLKGDMARLIQCGESYFNQIPRGVRAENIRVEEL